MNQTRERERERGRERERLIVNSQSIRSSTAMSSSSSSASAFSSLIRMSTSTDRDVTYSCGCCGYALNLSSCNRNTSVIGSEYDKAMKRGVISFFCIDESRFTHITKFRCLPYFRSKHSWGLFRRHTKLLCRECGTYIGTAAAVAAASSSYTYPSSSSVVNPQSQQWDGLSACRSYDIKICSLTPSSEEPPHHLLSPPPQEAAAL